MVECVCNIDRHPYRQATFCALHVQIVSYSIIIGHDVVFLVVLVTFTLSLSVVKCDDHVLLERTCTCACS